MFVLVEQVSPFKGVYEYDVFLEDTEINYSNILFSVRAYYLESIYSKIGNAVDLFVFNNNYFSKDREETMPMLESLKKLLIEELKELGVDENTKMDIKIVED